jgi:hypothetical protein
MVVFHTVADLDIFGGELITPTEKFFYSKSLVAI